LTLVGCAHCQRQQRSNILSLQAAVVVQQAAQTVQAQAAVVAVIGRLLVLRLLQDRL
jgi:hypothetical protein